jgi:hypothetical protein
VSQPVNLNKFRKAKARADKQTRAEANTVKFGMTKLEKNQQAQKADQAARLLDGHKLNETKE